MNEFSVLLGTFRGIAMVSFGATLLVAAGLAIFSGRTKSPAVDEAQAEPIRKAA